MGLLIFRGVIIALVAATGYFYPPFRMTRPAGAAVALVLGVGFMILEARIRSVQFKVIWSAALGTFSGILVGWLIGTIYQTVVHTDGMGRFIRIFFLIIMPYIGFLIGTRKGEWLDPNHLATLFREAPPGSNTPKIMDTSVIIDGRIADLCDTGFIEGPLLVPQFVLKELQFIADSPDALKRQRGRRGLDVLDRLQKHGEVEVRVSELDHPDVRDVDSKLIAVAKELQGKILTNDFNLNKVATLQEIPVLNINELANSLKPVVLPGETMQVFIIKEGKEKDQGVAYLDDGTMVVVDNSRRMIGQTIGVTVTSVLQTTVGKMIFGRYNGEAR